MKERVLTSHKVNGLNEAIQISVLDEPGDGGACHEYDLSLPDPDGHGRRGLCRVSFQNGPIKEAGFNGLTQEALIAICIDRLEGFQSGQFRCRENDIALTKLQEAQMWLQKRTMDRMKRGVEGTHKA